jgi:plastocyanin
MLISVSAGRRGAAVGAIAAGVLAVALTVAALAPAASQHRVQRRAQTVHVNIHDFAFHPHTLKVERGTKVVFANRDHRTHTATSRGSFSTGRIHPGHAVAVRFKHRGVFLYHCLIHAEMHGKIVVH